MRETMKEPSSVIIADDHPIVREGLVRTIEREKSFTIVGQAGDGAEAMRLITDLHPDIALLDISMPILDGLAVARRVHQQALLTELVLLTMHKDPEYLNAALDLGVRGYLVKESVTADLITCLNAVLSGQHYVSPVISHLLIERRRKTAPSQDQLPPNECLTPAEISVLRLVVENKTNKEIADTLSVSVRTVENHRARMCGKLGIKGHNELLLFAIEHRGRY